MLPGRCPVLHSRPRADFAGKREQPSFRRCRLDRYRADTGAVGEFSGAAHQLPIAVVGHIDADDDQNMEIAIVEFEAEEEVAEEEVFFIVEDMPSFQGQGQEGFRTWIAKNLRYPEIAAENGISGKVYVQFAVNSKGQVVDAVVVRGVDPALDKEAQRVVLASPKWSPGKQRGKAVKVQFTFPINFVLQ